MSEATPSPIGSRRVDGRRNRERLIETARRAFATSTSRATLDSIAKDAGVGIGTLYRHFPSRESLVEAVYRDELSRLCERASDADCSHTGRRADGALRAWMDAYVDFVAAKRGMADELAAVIAAGSISSPQTRGQLSAAVSRLLEHGCGDGSLRCDVLAEDVTASMAGVVLAGDVTGSREQIGRMLDLLLAGLRPPPDGDAGVSRSRR